MLYLFDFFVLINIESLFIEINFSIKVFLLRKCSVSPIKLSIRSLSYSKLELGGVESSSHALTWGAYAEMYITPVQDLEWYFEMDVNNNAAVNTANVDVTPVYFETTTGITWYLPSFGGDTAQ